MWFLTAYYPISAIVHLLQSNFTGNTSGAIPFLLNTFIADVALAGSYR
jgi:hypothetical protein